MIKNKILIIGLFFLIQFNPALGSNWVSSLYSPKSSVMERLSVSLTGGVLGIGAGVVLASGAAPVLAFAVLGGLVGDQWYKNKHDDKKHSEREQKQQELLDVLDMRRQEILSNSARIEAATSLLGTAMQANTGTKDRQDETLRLLSVTAGSVAATQRNNQESIDTLFAAKGSIQAAESQLSAANCRVGELGAQLKRSDTLQSERHKEQNSQMDQMRRKQEEERIRRTVFDAERDRQIGELHEFADGALSAFEWILLRKGVDPRVIYGMGGLKRGVRIPSVLGSPADNSRSTSVIRQLLLEGQVTTTGDTSSGVSWGRRTRYLKCKPGASGHGITSRNPRVEELE